MVTCKLWNEKKIHNGYKVRGQEEICKCRHIDQSTGCGIENNNQECVL